MILANASPFDTFDTLMGWQKANQGVRDALLVAGAAILMALLVLAWAVFIRKRRRRRDYPQPVARAQNLEKTNASAKRRKWHRRRKEHRPRNPTLAETGGLPPVKTPSPNEPMN